MKKIIFILLLILTTPIAHGNFYGEQNIFDIKSQQGSNWYNKYGIKGESPITHEEKLKRLEIANYYADFFWKNYFLLQNKYIKPEYQGIPYENFNRRYQYDNMFTDYSKNYFDKYNTLNSYEKSYFRTFNVENSSQILPLFDYFHSLNRNFFDSYIKLSNEYINGVTDWNIEKNLFMSYFDTNERGNQITKNYSKDPLENYVLKIKHLLEENLITKSNQCATSNTYVSQNNGLTHSIVEGGVSLDFFVRGSRIGYYKKDGDNETLCHNSFEDINKGIYNISNDFLKFRQSYIDFFDLNKNSYSNPKTIEVDVDYGHYINFTKSYRGKQNDPNFDYFLTKSGRKPSVKIGTFGNNLEKSLFEKIIGDFVNDRTHPLSTWMDLTDVGEFNNFLPYYYDQRRSRLDPTTLKKYYEFEDGLYHDTVRAFHLSRERILPYNYVSGSLSRDQINKLVEDNQNTGNVDIVEKISETKENNYNLNTALLSQLNKNYYKNFNNESELVSINNHISNLNNFATYSNKRDKLFGDINRIISPSIKNNPNKYADFLRKLNGRLDTMLPQIERAYKRNPSRKNKNNYELLLIVKEWVVYTTHNNKQSFYITK